MTYAIIETGGKQYRVQEGDQITVEKLTAELGKKVTLDQVLMVKKAKEAVVGTPLVAGAKVEAEVLEQSRAPKIIVFKKKRRKGYHKTIGHRQRYTQIRIDKITN